MMVGICSNQQSELSILFREMKKKALCLPQYEALFAAIQPRNMRLFCQPSYTDHIIAMKLMSLNTAKFLYQTITSPAISSLSNLCDWSVIAVNQRGFVDESNLSNSWYISGIYVSLQVLHIPDDGFAKLLNR